MCEFLIAADDWGAPGNPRVGDVVVAFGDGHGWGLSELRDPRFRILLLPGVDAADFADALAPELPTGPNAANQTSAHYRAYYLDFTSPRLSAAFLAYIADATRAAPSFTLTPQLARALVTRRPSIQPGA